MNTHRFRFLLALLLTLACLSACGGSELMPWHKKILTKEYGKPDAGEVDSFNAYLQLEQRLFAELQREIYALNGTGSEHSLERYSTGSLADPEQRSPNWNRSFELAGQNPNAGVLLLHGMSDSPYSLRAMGETLHQRNYHVIGLRMPGHGTIPSGLLDVDWRDMSRIVSLGMQHLQKQLGDKPIHIIGYSTGAALALDYALEHEQRPPASLVLVSPAIGLSPAAPLAKWQRRLSLVPGLNQLAWLSIDPEFDPYKYNSFTTNAAEQVYRLTDSVSRRIAARDKAATPLPPTLVLKSTVDATVSNNAVIDRLLSRLTPARHQLVVFDINRFANISSLLRDDPGPFTQRLIADEQLSFGVTLVSNSERESRSLSAYHKEPMRAGPSRIDSLDTQWPRGVFSLSHVALPFPPDDPIYGQARPPHSKQVFLGQQAPQGERGVLVIPGEFFLRLRHNPFYDYLESRILNWLE